MKKEYRPYAVTDLVLNLHNRINKAMMTKLLDDMVDEGVLIVKRYGKMSFYCYRELKNEVNVDSIKPENLKSVKEEIDKYESISLEYKKQIIELNNEPTDKEIEQTIIELKNKANNLQDLIDKHSKQSILNYDSVRAKLESIEQDEVKMMKKYKSLKKIVCSSKIYRGGGRRGKKEIILTFQRFFFLLTA